MNHSQLVEQNDTEILGGKRNKYEKFTRKTANTRMSAMSNYQNIQSVDEETMNDRRKDEIVTQKRKNSVGAVQPTSDTSLGRKKLVFSGS